MTRFSVLVAAYTFLVAIPAQILAENTWCYTNHADAIYCEDFDRYCVNPPAAPGRCDLGADRDTWAMWDVWSVMHNCGWAPAVHDENYSSSPYSAKIGCQGWNNELGYANDGLSNQIQSKFGNAFTQVLGTDLTPLTLEFGIHGGAKAHADNLYVELGRGRGGPLFAGVDSLTNWIQSPQCSLCGNSGDQAYYPIICRQTPTPAGCADPAAAPVLPAIAAGFLSFLDQDPCHCTETDHWPRVDRLSVFDGRVWHTLHKGDFPDPGGSEPAPGDFLLSSAGVYHRIKLTFKSTSVIVEMNVAGVLSRCEMPRVYQGSFDSILMGYQMPCQLVDGTWNCNEAVDCNGPCGPAKTCCVSGTNGGGTVAVDDFALYGGQGYAAMAACCMPDTSCTEEYQGNCQVIGGQPGPAGSTCEDHACCPSLKPDHDMDGDVDLADFGWFQTCLSGPESPTPTVPCRCADYQADNHVDAIDMGIFLGCMLGPEIPADPNCAD